VPHDFTAMDKDASLADDQMVRMRMIEEATHSPRGTYSSGGARGFFEMAEEVPRQHPDIDPAWFDRKDFDLRGALVKGVSKVIGQFGATGRNDVEEVVQNMGGGLSAHSLASKDDVYGTVGKKYGNAILSGKMSPKDMWRLLYGAAANRARDEWKERMRKKKDREKSSPTLLRTEDQGSLVDSANSMMSENPTGVFLQLLSSPAGNKFKNWLYKTVQSRGTEMQKALLEVFIEDPAGSHTSWGRNPKIIETTQKKEPISRQMIGKHWNNLVKLIRKEMKGQPKIYEWMEDQIDLQALGYGGAVRASAKRIVSAQRVAARYLKIIAKS